MSDNRIRIDWDKLESLCDRSKRYNKAKLSGLLGRSDSYLSQVKRTTGTVTEYEFELLCELLKAEPEELIKQSAMAEPEKEDPSPGENEIVAELRKQTEIMQQIMQQIMEALLEFATKPQKPSVKPGKSLAVKILSDMIEKGDGKCKKQDFYTECVSQHVEPMYIDCAIRELGLIVRTEGFKENAVSWIVTPQTKTVQRI